MNEVNVFEELIGQEAKNTSPSPYGRWLNGKLLAAKVGALEVSFEVRKDFANPAGIMHGGVLAGIMDEVIGMTTFSLGLGGFYVAANLNVDFLRPANVGEVIVASSEVIRSGKTLAHVECRITSETTGKLIAKSTSNMIKTVLK